MKTIHADQCRDMVIAACDAIIKNKPYLTEIDSAIGDGDHGIGMSGGMEKAETALKGKDFATVADVFKTTGMTMLNSMGGASGVIFGSMFLGGVKSFGTDPELNCKNFSEAMRAALDSIQARGKASVGDKTMVDALEPAVAAMEKSDTEDLTVMLGEAADAADTGIEATKNMIAKFGRAKSLGERALGHQDAGATSVGIIFRAMAEYLKTTE